MSEHKSPIATTVISGLLLAGSLWLLSFVPGLFATAGQIGVAFWSHLHGTSGLPNWGLYLLVLISIHSFAYWAIRLRKPYGPSVTEYNQDTFFGLIWRWSFISGHPEKIWAFCPSDDTALVYSERRLYGDSTVTLTCETCNKTLLTEQGDKDYLIAKVHRQITRKIRTGEWETVIKSSSEQSAQADPTKRAV